MSVAFSYVNPKADRIQRPIRQYKFEWTSDASGDASGSTGHVISGLIRRIATDPDNTAAPTANYDVTITDESGVDVLGGGGVDRHTSNSEQVIPSQPIAVDNVLTLVVAGAGNAKSGVVYIYVSN